MNALEQDFSGIDYPFSDVPLASSSCDSVFPGHANKRLKRRNISYLPMIDVVVGFAMPGIDRKMSYSGKG